MLMHNTILAINCELDFVIKRNYYPKNKYEMAHLFLGERKNEEGCGCY